MKDFNGFTLAEVLLTLVIIGVIAAITIPLLHANYTERQTVAALTKAYSQISNAVTMAEAQNGPINTWDFMGDDSTSNSSQKFSEYVTRNLSIQKTCEFADKGCFAEKYKTLNGKKTANYNTEAANGSKLYKFILNDGMAAGFQIRYPKCDKNFGSNKYLQNICGHAYIDVNGHKGPNVCGKDMFELWITAYGIYPRGTKFESNTSKSSLNNNEGGCSNTTKGGYGCSGWIITKGNMDYLKKTVSW